MKDNEKRIEIRQKALQLFKEKGYDAVTVNEIAAAANISKNTFYYYYKTKDDLLLEWMDPANINFEKLLGDLLIIEKPVDQFLYLIEKMCDFVEDLGREVIKRSMILNISGELDISHKHGHKPSEKQIQTLRILRNMMEKAMEKGEMRSDLNVKEIHHMLVAMLIGCMHVWSNSKEMFSLKAQYIAMVKSSLLIKIKE